MDVTDEQWALVQPLIPQRPMRADGRGRPRIDDRQIRNGMVGIARTGAAGKAVPERAPAFQTCHCRFQERVKAGVFARILQALVRDVNERGDLDLSAWFIAGSLVIANKWLRGGNNQAGQRCDAHGSGRPHGSSCRRIRWTCCAA